MGFPPGNFGETKVQVSQRTSHGNVRNVQRALQLLGMRFQCRQCTTHLAELTFGPVIPLVLERAHGPLVAYEERCFHEAVSQGRQAEGGPAYGRFGRE